MSIDRTDLVRKAFVKKAPAVEIPEEKISEYFAERVFDRAKMRKYLDPKTLQALFECIDEGTPVMDGDLEIRFTTYKNKNKKEII